MDATELRQKTSEELKALDHELRRTLFDLRFKHYTGNLTGSAEIRQARRGIARVATVLRERQILQSAKQ